MHQPAHPGEALKADVLPALGLTVTEAADQLGVSRITLSRVLNGKAGISAEMALRLAKWIGGEPDIWLREQMQFDLWKARKESKIKVKKAKPAKQLLTPS